MPILLDRNPLHIDPRRRRMPVAKCILRLDDTPRGFTHPPGKRVACLVQVDIPEAGPPSVHFDPLGKGMPGQLCTAM